MAWLEFRAFLARNALRILGLYLSLLIPYGVYVTTVPPHSPLEEIAQNPAARPSLHAVLYHAASGLREGLGLSPRPEAPETFAARIAYRVMSAFRAAGRVLDAFAAPLWSAALAAADLFSNRPKEWYVLKNRETLDVEARLRWLEREKSEAARVEASSAPEGGWRPPDLRPGRASSARGAMKRISPARGEVADGFLLGGCGRNDLSCRARVLLVVPEERIAKKTEPQTTARPETDAASADCGEGMEAAHDGAGWACSPQALPPVRKGVEPAVPAERAGTAAEPVSDSREIEVAGLGKVQANLHGPLCGSGEIVVPLGKSFTCIRKAQHYRFVSGKEPTFVGVAVCGEGFVARRRGRLSICEPVPPRIAQPLRKPPDTAVTPRAELAPLPRRGSQKGMNESLKEREKLSLRYESTGGKRGLDKESGEGGATSSAKNGDSIMKKFLKRLDEFHEGNVKKSGALQNVRKIRNELRKNQGKEKLPEYGP